jgi:chromosome partitioning protein
MILSTKIGKELILSGALEITRSHYDVIVLDCPPNLGTLTLNALCAADQLLIPSDMSVLALQGIGDILTAADTVQRRLGRSLRVLGILATRFDGRTKRANETIINEVTELYGDCLLETRIPQSSALNRAHIAGKPIFDFDANSPGAAAYDKLAGEIVARLSIRLPSAGNLTNAGGGNGRGNGNPTA